MFVVFLTFSKKDKEQALVSPIPNFLNILQNKEVSSINLWLPILENFIKGESDKPEISAKSALVLDLDSKKVIYEKNPKEKLAFASLAKIMTAIIALENPKKDNKYLISQKNLIGENSIVL